MQKQITVRLLKMSHKKIIFFSKQIKGKNLLTASQLLYNYNNLAARVLYKIIKQVSFDIDQKNLDNVYLKKIYVNKGPYVKKIFTRSQGRVNYIKKKRSHITIFVDNF
jgi:large subunit ribosomal protein L22